MNRNTPITTIVVSLSGGKDSTAVVLLALEYAAKHNCRVIFVFADTGNEHEITLAYLFDYLAPRLGVEISIVRADFSKDIARKRIYCAEKWPGKGVPDDIIQRAIAALVSTGIPFLDLCIWKGRFPSRKAQFCTQELKRYPMDAFMGDLLADGPLESWRGIRRDESQNRKDAKSEEMTPEGWKVVHPIVDWTAQRTVDFVISHGVELNPLYSQGMKRVGCMPCINCGKDELLEIARRFPAHIDRIREWESLVAEASKRGFSTFFATDTDGTETDAEIAAKGRIDQRVEWAKTSRGGVSYDLERFMPPSECSSVYGLCE